MRRVLSLYHHLVLAALAVVLVVAVVLGVASLPAKAETVTDPGQDRSVEEAVQALTDAGILLGRDAASFVSEDPVTRAQMAAYIARALGMTETRPWVFGDIAPDEWYAGAVGALYDARVLSGSGPNTFSPDDPVTREQATSWLMAAIGYRMEQDPDYSVPFRLSPVEQGAWLGGFRDRALIDAGAALAVANAYRLGLVEAFVDGWFCPDLPLSRGEGAVMLYRAFLRSMKVRDKTPDLVEAESGYPNLTRGSEGPLVRYVESKLASLHYYPGPVDGVYDEKTRDAVMAFEKVERLTRDGVVGDSVWEHLVVAQTPLPHLEADGYRVEVDLTRQVMFMIDNDRVWKIVHVSTGKRGTMTGHHVIGTKQPGWVKLVTLDGYFYYPSYIVSRTAIHGYPSVPPWPASHGCVRTPMWMAEEIYYQLPKGTPVDVFYT